MKHAPGCLRSKRRRLREPLSDGRIGVIAEPVARAVGEHEERTAHEAEAPEALPYLLERRAERISTSGPRFHPVVPSPRRLEL